MQTMLTKKNIAAALIATAGLLVGSAAMAADAPDGAALWAKNCASCHGKDLKGKTKTGEKLKIQDLTDAAVKAKFDKKRMIESTTKGIKEEGGEKLVMKAYETKLSAAEIEALVDFVIAYK